MKSNMVHQFSQIPRVDIQRSSFSRNHGYKTTFDAGYLIPFFLDEVLPGDTFNLSASIFARLATPITPIMDNIFIDTFFFFVPNRLLWDNWQRFNGEQDNPTDSTDYLVPTVSSGADLDDSLTGLNTLWDYFGLPHVANLDVSALPFRAYNLIWNDWFRDENLQPSATVNNDLDAGDSLDYYFIRRRGKRHDYFTSCLPWPQKGPGVMLPLGGVAPVVGTGDAIGVNSSSSTEAYRLAANSSGTLFITPQQPNISYEDPAQAVYTGLDNVSIGVSTAGGSSGLVADLSDATAATINSLRQAFAIQRLYERDARGGTRYTEILRSHFGVVSPDGRLQRPEYLGGSSQRLNVYPVQQTSSTDATTPQGNLAAYGVFSDSVHGFSRSFTEHGYIIGLINARADLNYQYGVNRMWTRQGRFDFYWPALANLGEQAVLNKEIYAQGSAVLSPSGEPWDDLVFGYQERFAEYRYKPSMITGLFRSSAPDSLDYWHLAQTFSGLPSLNSSFIQDNPPIDRVIAVPSEPHFLLDVFFKLNTVRPMPVYSVPGLIDHF
ncbi:major capsid protein [Tortoise microvirus 50]|nr:major capsid protein [Tortoise microvirus 50]